MPDCPSLLPRGPFDVHRGWLETTSAVDVERLRLRQACSRIGRYLVQRRPHYQKNPPRMRREPVHSRFIPEPKLSRDEVEKLERACQAIYRKFG